MSMIVNLDIGKTTILQLVSVTQPACLDLTLSQIKSAVIFSNRRFDIVLQNCVNRIPARIIRTHKQRYDRLPLKTLFLRRSTLRFPLILCAFEAILNEISVKLEPTNNIFECKLSPLTICIQKRCLLG